MAIGGSSGMNRGRRIGMLLYGALAYDSRVRREATALAEAGFSVVLACLSGTEGTPSLPPGVDVRVVRPDHSTASPIGATPYTAVTGSRTRVVGQARWIGTYAREVRAWGRAAIRACGDVDVWHVHDLPALAAASPMVRAGARVVYDSHEIYLDAGTAAVAPSPVRRLLRAYEGRLVHAVDAVVTVCDPLAEVLTERYHPRQIVVVYNAPPKWTPPAEPPDHIRQSLGLPASARVVLTHGLLSPDRGVFQLAEAMTEPGLDDTHLVYLGSGPSTERLAELSHDQELHGRLHLLPKVAPTELLEWVASSDVVAMPILPTTLNHRLATPNKLLEALAAGVPVVASHSEGMAPIIQGDPGGGLGFTCDPSEPASIAAGIRAILAMAPPEYADLRRRCLQAAHTRWNWENESAKLLALYGDRADG